MEEEQKLILLGLSGQGILFAAKVLAHAAFLDGFKATFIPNFGPQVQNGPVKAEVIISKDDIYNPFVDKADYILLFHKFMIEESKNSVKENGVILCKDFIIDSSNSYKTMKVNVEPIIENLNKPLLANLAMAGAFSGVSGMISDKSIREALKYLLSDKPFNFVSMNLEAYKQGKELFKV